MRRVSVTVSTVLFVVLAMFAGDVPPVEEADFEQERTPINDTLSFTYYCSI